MNLLAVMSVHNGEATVARAVESVRRQGIRMLVVCDGCTDGTVDVLKRLQNRLGMMTIIGNPKAADWQRELAWFVEFEAKPYEHIVGMGADDYLLPGYAEAMKSAPESFVMLPDYYFVNERGQATGVSTSGFVADTRVTRAHVQDLFADDKNPFAPAWRPSGVGCAMRADLWLGMMHKREAWKCGPASDTIPLNLMACQVGATFIPKKLAAFTRRADSYGATQFRERREEVAKACGRHLKHWRGEVSHEACDGIFTKWFPEYKQ